MKIKKCCEHNINFFKHGLQNDSNDEFKKYFANDNNNWIKKLIQGEIIKDFTPTQLEMDLTLSDLDISDDKKPAKTDFENAKRVFTKLNISPVEASDAEMWTWMCLDEFYPYIKYRWGFRKGDYSSAKVIERFFYEPDSKASKSGNSMARLWWIAHLTYDDSIKGDPFRYTRLICSNQNYVTSIMERNYSNNKQVVLSYLRACEQILSEGKIIDTRVIQSSCTFLDRIGGIYILDCMSEEKLQNIMVEHIRNSI